MTATNRLGLEKPSIGLPDWGDDLNDGFDRADSRFFKLSTDFLLAGTQIETPVFIGVGLNDLTKSGTFTGVRDRLILVRVVATAPSPDTFEWSGDGGVTWTGPINMALAPTVLVEGVAVAWASIDGHTIGDVWSIVTKALERQDPNDINGDNTPLTVDYVGQRYLYARDAVWWVATAISVWERETPILIGSLADRQPRPTTDSIFVDEATGIKYFYDTTLAQWIPEDVASIPVPPASALKVLRVNSGGTDVEFGPKLVSPAPADARKFLKVNAAGDGFDIAALQENLAVKVANEVLGGGGAEHLVAVLSNLLIPGPTADGSRRIYVKFHVRLNNDGIGPAQFTLRVRSGPNGDLTDAAIYADGHGIINQGNVDGFVFDGYMTPPLNATKFSITLQANNPVVFTVFSSPGILVVSDFVHLREING